MLLSIGSVSSAKCVKIVHANFQFPNTCADLNWRNMLRMSVTFLTRPKSRCLEGRCEFLLLTTIRLSLRLARRC